MPKAADPASPARSIPLSRRPVKAWVPPPELVAATSKQDDDEDPIESAPPVDPEIELERLAKARRRKKGAVTALVFAGILVAAALLLQSTLGSNPPVAAELEGPPLSETLSDTWVAKKLQEAKDGTAGEADAANPSGPSTIRPIDAATIAAGAARNQQHDPRDPRAQRGAPTPAPVPSPPPQTAAPRIEPAPPPIQGAGDQTASAPKTASAQAAPAKKAEGIPSQKTQPAKATQAVKPVAKPGAKAASAGKVSVVEPEEEEGDEAPVPVGIPEELADGEQPQVISLSELALDPSEEAAPTATAKAPSRPWPSPKGSAPQSGGTGSLSLVTLPRASVSLNGIAMGSTPLHGRQVPSGRLQLRLIGSDDIPRVLTVDVADGEDVELKVPLSRLWPEELKR